MSIRIKRILGPLIGRFAANLQATHSVPPTPIQVSCIHISPDLPTSARPSVARQPHRRSLKDSIVEATTGPFDIVKNLSALVALDLENVDRSARDLGRAVDYQKLAEILQRGIGPQAHLIAIYSRDDSDLELARPLREAGWATYTRPIDVVRTREGSIRYSNADVAFATAVGAAAVALNVDGVVLGTGDGQLAIDVVRCLKATVPGCKMAATLSLPGSTSRRLDARRSDIIDLNIEIGDDAMRPLVGERFGTPLSHLRARAGHRRLLTDGHQAGRSVRQW